MSETAVCLKLYGTMADKYGAAHELYVRSPAEALRLMSVNYPGFDQDLAAEPSLFLLVDGKPRGVDGVEGGVDQAIALVPAEAGAKDGWESALAIAGVALLVATGVGFFAGGTGVASLFGTGLTGGAAALHSSLVYFGLSYALTAAVSYATRNDAIGDASDPGTKRLGATFGGPINASQPGLPVAIGYGRLRVGSFVVSQSISPQDRPDLLSQGL